MSNRPPITFHILDTALGIPGKGIRIELHRNTGASMTELEFNDSGRIGECVTNDDGRGSGLIPADCKTMEPGVYKMTFHTLDYFKASNTPSFYPKVEVIFQIVDPTQHYHVPLLLSPFGYSTYRGS